MKKLKYGIIGCGLIAEWHAGAVRELQNQLPVELCAVADADPERARQYAGKHGIKAFDTVEQLLESDIDIVSICTPSGFHGEIAVAAANHKKHVVVEKPMAITERQLNAVVEACQKNGVKLASISQLRYSKEVQAVRNAVQSGELGRMVCADVYMKHYRSPEYYSNSGWRGTKALDGGGALMNQGIHGVDLLQYIMGPIKTVYAKSKTLVHKIECEDTLAAVAEFENGAVGVIQATTSICPGYPKQLCFHGDAGSIRMEENCVTEWISKNGLPDDIKLQGAQASGASAPDSIGIEGHVAQIRDLITCVIEDKTPFVDCNEGRRAVDVILAIYASAENGKEINIQDFVNQNK